MLDSSELLKLNEIQKKFYNSHVANRSYFQKLIGDLNENIKVSKNEIENLKKENFELKNQLLERDASVLCLKDQNEKQKNEINNLKISYEAEIQNSKSLSAHNSELKLENADQVKKLQEKNNEIEEMKTKFKEFVQFFSKTDTEKTEHSIGIQPETSNLPNNASCSKEIDQQPSLTTSLENPIDDYQSVDVLNKEPFQTEQLCNPPKSLDNSTADMSVENNSAEQTPAFSNIIVEIKTEKIFPILNFSSYEDTDDDDETLYSTTPSYAKTGNLSPKRKAKNDVNTIEAKRGKFSLFSFEKEYFQKIADFKSARYSKLVHYNQLSYNETKTAYKLNLATRKKDLTFTFDEECFDLKPFDVLQINDKLDCKILNVGSEITALDWCIDDPKSPQGDQYFAFTCNKRFTIDSLSILNEKKDIIFIGKLSQSSNPNECNLGIFGIFDEEIGKINDLKWGTLNSKDKKNSIGYLLIASSDGNGYIVLVDDILENTSKSFLAKSNDTVEHKKVFSINGIDCYKPENKIELKNSCEKPIECVSCDWNQNNGANQTVALGYLDGSIRIFYVKKDKHSLKASSKLQSSSSIDILKWSKTNNSPKQFYTGSLKEKIFNQKLNSISMAIKGWNSNVSTSQHLKVKGELEDFDLTIDNKLIACNQKDTCGKSHLVSSDLNQGRSCNTFLSPFSTNESINSINVSDYLDKILVTVADGSIILSSSHKTWKSKDKNADYARILKFSQEMDSNKIKIDNTIVCDKDEWAESKNSNDDDNGVVSLNKVKWNPNAKFSNWFMCAGSPGFLFINKINEIKLD